MTDTALFAPFRPARDDTRDKPAPNRPSPGPVLIHDCIAPVQGTTLLHLLWQRLENPPQDNGG